MRKGGVQKYISLMRYVNQPRSPQNFILHPLIHTIPPANSEPNMVVGSQAINCDKGRCFSINFQIVPHLLPNQFGNNVPIINSQGSS